MVLSISYSSSIQIRRNDCFYYQMNKKDVNANPYFGAIN